MKEDKKVVWRKLDNSAKLFPSVSNKRFSTVFRISVLLKEKIEPFALQMAVNQALEKFVSFKVKLRKGLFWYFLEENEQIPVVEEEHNYPCKYIDPVNNNGYLFKVTYFENKINLDVFHTLTDGNTAIRFFKAIVYNYLETTHVDNFEVNRRDKSVVINDTEDSYLKNYNKHLGSREKSRTAYVLKGKKLPLFAIGVIHGYIDLPKLKEVCKEKDVTITGYLTAVLIRAIYEENYKKHNGKKPIRICIPINLKKYFASTTMSNFFSYITLEADVQKDDFDNFDNILDFVKNNLKKQLNEDKVTKTMSANVKWGNNIFVKLIPLFLKNMLLKISYMIIRRYTTTTLSNLGRISVLPEYKDYIDKFLLLLAPEPVEKIKCSACSYEDKLIFTFTSILEDISIEKGFFKYLEAQGIFVELESNEVHYDLSKID